jgi:hypothetical protein
MKKFLLIVTLLCSIRVVGQTLENDRLALVALYNSTNGSGWTNKTGWVVPGSTGDNPCGWFGVTCNVAGTRVVGLNLADNRFQGELPALIGNLSALVSLDMTGGSNGLYTECWLAGQLPEELGSLTNLMYLNLGKNHFSGPLPSTLGQLTKLKILDLSFVPFDAGFDRVGEITGSIPQELGQLVDLEFLDLSLQNLSGNIPDQLGQLAALKHLNLGFNDFTGTIPLSFSNLSKLTYLNLSYQYDPSYRVRPFGRLGGTIPDFSSLPTDAQINISNQSFTFDGMEQNISRLVNYSPQNTITLLHGRKYQFGDPEYDPQDYHEYLWVSAGGTESLNEYKLSKDGNIASTQTGDKWFDYATGAYKIQVKNSGVPGLTLTSNQDFFFAGPIPVRLTSFMVKSQRFQNLLTWKTTTETNNSGFEIEKSRDAKTFEKIGFVDGNGNSKEQKSYSFTDTNPFATTYYRLKQIDLDGKFEYSRVISVKNESLKLAIYPNPAQDQLFVTNIEKSQRVSISNISGEILLDQIAQAGIPISTGKIPNGLYMIKVGNETRKILIQR